MTPYDSNFYGKECDLALRSARRVAPLVLDMVHPRSIVDVGCGTAVWLSVFREHGIDDILGVDGDYVDRAALAIPQSCFRAADLSRLLQMDRRFDLAVSLETAEHLSPESADAFVDSLVRLAPVLLFSAAIPHQGGVHHVNEQWPRYWTDRFARHGFEPIDALRHQLWDDADVAWYYAQNIILLAHRDHLQKSARLRDLRRSSPPQPLPLVHPSKYLELIESIRSLELTARDLASIIPPGECFILVDEEQLRATIAGGWRALPFLECDGAYHGRPADDQSAINECLRLRAAGARFIALARPAFWWLDHYAQFHQYLRGKFPCILHNDRIVVFSLTPKP